MSKLLLDTHVVVRWLAEPSKLSREQLRVLRNAVHRGEQLASSDMTLLEAAVLSGKSVSKLKISIAELLLTMNSAIFKIIPVDIEIATEVAAMGDALRDPADRAIVATARVHRLSVVTSDQRITESKLVPVID